MREATELSPAAERLRAELISAPDEAAEGFVAWKRRRGFTRTAAWLAGIALMSPGALCFFAHAPTGVSALIEVAGIGANWWLRRLRRNHLAAIKSWEPGRD